MKSNLIVADDGSTAVKLAYKTEKGVQTFISPNRAEIGKGISFGKPPYVYRVEPETDNASAFYTFGEQKNALPTSNKAYQFHVQSRASVHHALNMANIKSDNIDLVVTLPINMYFNADGSENTENIQKKKDTHTGFIESVNHNTYKIKSVKVYPEGIPAILMHLQDSEIKRTDVSMLLDIGGTTTDGALFVGKMEELIKVDSFMVGTFEVMESIRAELSNSLSNIITMHLDLILRHFDDPVYLKENLNIEIDIFKHLTAVFERGLREIIEFNGGEISNTNIFVTGGGAKLLAFFLNEKGIQTTVLKRPETALCEAIYMLESQK